MSTKLVECQIGELDVRWNLLVGEYHEPPADVKNVHWTLGVPYFHECEHANFAIGRNKQRNKMLSCMKRR